MANYDGLKGAIQNNYEWDNGQNKIIGPDVEQCLLALIDSLGVGFQYMGVATPETDPGTPDQRVFYVASTQGIYPNFNNLTIGEFEVALFVYGDGWEKQATEIPSKTQVLNRLDAQDSNIAQFEAAVRNMVENYPNITINGNVVNAPDQEDITTDENDLLKFANRPALNGMGYIILRKNKTFAEQVTEQNTIYEIRYDFDLDGDSITLPNNCVLRFDGGSLQNGTIIFNSTTQIEGNPIILCEPNGYLNKADITWFGVKSDDNTIDCGEIINKVQAITKHLIIPFGNYYIKDTPIIISYPDVVDWFGAINYIGSSTDIDCVTFTGQLKTLNFFGVLYNDCPNTNYTTANMTNIRGLVFKNYANSIARIGSVFNFNVNMVVMGEGAGCCNNQFFISLLKHGNIGILVTQKNDSNDNIGWTNENRFIGGNINNYSSWDYTNCESHAVVCKKIYNDDDYNRVNCLTFIKQNVEGIKVYPAFLFENVSRTVVRETRCEQVDLYYKLIGTCTSIQFDALYPAVREADYSELTGKSWYPYKDANLSVTEKYSVEDNALVFKAGNKAVSRGKLVAFTGAYTNISYDIPISDGNANMGVVIRFKNPTKETILKITGESNGQTDKRIIINGTTFTSGSGTDKSNTIIAGTGMYYNTSSNLWLSGSDTDSAKIIFNKGVEQVHLSYSNVSGFCLEYDPIDIEIVNNQNYNVEDIATHTIFNGYLKDNLHIRFQEESPYYHSNILVTGQSHNIQVPFNYKETGVLLPYVAGAIYKIKANDYFYAFVIYYDANGNVLDSTAPISHQSNISFIARTGGSWRTISDRTSFIFENPSIQDAAFVSIMFGRGSSTTVAWDNFEGSICSNIIQYPICEKIITEGETSDRPSNVWSGFEYFDITLGKPIYAKFTATNTFVWIDATGNTLT